MYKSIIDLAKKAGLGNIQFAGFDLKQQFAGIDLQIAPLAFEYFLRCVPETTIDLEFVRILQGTAIIEHNTEYVPGCLCAPFGFITIATDYSGDAMAMDVTTGHIYHLSHEKYESDGIHGGWDVKLNKFPDPIALSHDSIIDASEGFWTAPELFFQDLLDYAEQL